ncbi:MAG: hypothetical protein Q9183_002334 [Haloplaca sp. 2 TL-2023]
MKQASIVVVLVLSLSKPAFCFDLRLRADPIDPCLDQAPTLDGPTSDKSAGIGVEFEATQVTLKTECSAEDTNAAKGKQIDDRGGDNWQLTADTTLDSPGLLTAEYILNGKLIKIGDGAASAAAAAVAEDIIAWDPNQAMPNNEWDIEDNKCNPWAVDTPAKAGGAGNLNWAVQVTAPLPFEAINDLFIAALAPVPVSPLLPSGRRAKKNVVSVTQDFFQSSPNGIAADSVKADALGFLSLVVSYAKAGTQTASKDYTSLSPKFTLSIMPRTDFVTLYAQVKSSLPGTGTLYDLIKVLACYENIEEDVE